ncbi:MAG: AMP-binding protein [Thiobacillaceae bacterium]
MTAPTALRMLRARAELSRALPDLKLVSVQGEPLDPETFDWTSAHFGSDGGVPVINAYGQTETGSTWT